MRIFTRLALLLCCVLNLLANPADTTPPRFYFLAGGWPTPNEHDMYAPDSLAILGYPDGLVYYTTDGTEPSVLSTRYSTPILINTDITIRAIAYTADFSQSAVEQLKIRIVPLYTLRVGGALSAFQYSIDGGPFEGVWQGASSVPIAVGSNRLVTVRALESETWKFHKWYGLNASISQTNSFRMTQDQEIELRMVRNTSLEGQFANGQRKASPPPPYYSHEPFVQITAVPGPGFGFVGWAGQNELSISYPVSANSNPPNPQFAPLPTETQPLRAEVVGSGRFHSPNYIYANGAVAEITAIPAEGWAFDHWSGDAAGTTPTISLVMDAPKTVVAHMKRVLIYKGQFTYDNVSAAAIGSDGSLLTVQQFGNSSILRAYDPNDGTTRWQRHLGNSTPLVAPVVAPDGNIYTSRGSLLALTPSGAVRWEHPFNGIISLALSDQGIYASDGNLLRRFSAGGSLLQQVNYAGKLMALDPQSNVRSEGASVGPFIGHSSALAPQFSVEQSWFNERGTAIDSQGTSYKVISNLVRSRATNGLIAVNPQGQITWRGPDLAWSSLGHDHLFATDGDLHAIKLSDKSISWSFRPSTTREFIAHSVATADGGVILLTLPWDHRIVFLRRLSASGAVLLESQINTTGKYPTYPILTDNGILYFSTDFLIGCNVGIGPSTSGWPMQRANVRNTAQAGPIVIVDPIMNRLLIDANTAGYLLGYNPVDPGTMILQSSINLSEWSEVMRFTGPMEHQIPKSSEPARFYRVIPAN